MAKEPKDKQPAEIQYLLKSKGWVFAEVDRAFGLKSGIACQTARYPHLEGEMALSEVIELPPHQIWPSRYDRVSGVRLKPQPSANYKAARPSGKCQKSRQVMDTPNSGAGLEQNG